MEGGTWDDNFWSGACEEDTTSSGFDFELLLSKGFLPPPPRPPGFPDPPADGLTTCDLCQWATHNSSSIVDSISLMSWPVTLIIVSILSAVIGAAVMVSIRRCLKRINENPVPRRYSGTRSETEDKSSTVGEAPRSSGLCCWITRRTTARQSSALRSDIVTATNHYTLEETYSGGAEALYAELDKPVYQNTGYVLEPDTNSPPSSAYYSDLSDRTYETVGQGQTWEMHRYRPHYHQPPSDYV